MMSFRGSIGRELNKIAALGAVTLALGVNNSCRKQTSPATESALTPPGPNAIAEADQLYAGREVLNKVRQALILLRQSQTGQPSNYDLAWRLAKFNYYLGAHTPEQSERDKAFRDGIDAGKLAVKLQDGKPDGHFWLGANYGGAAQDSMLAGLAEIDEIKHEMEAVIKLDPGYESGSAYMGLGQVYLESPSMLGGDTQKAIDFFEKGIKLGPNNTLLHVRLAEAYLQAHRDADARREINNVLAAKATPGYEPEHNEAVALARKLQEKLK